MIPNNIMELVSEARLAISLPYQQKASECIRVMPLLIDALDKVFQMQYELTQIRYDLSKAVRELRDAIDEAKRTHFARGKVEQRVHEAVLKVNDALDRLDELIVRE